MMVSIKEMFTSNKKRVILLIHNMEINSTSYTTLEHYETYFGETFSISSVIQKTYKVIKHIKQVNTS